MDMAARDHPVAGPGGQVAQEHGCHVLQMTRWQIHVTQQLDCHLGGRTQHLEGGGGHWGEAGGEMSGMDMAPWPSGPAPGWSQAQLPHPTNSRMAAPCHTAAGLSPG